MIFLVIDLRSRVPIYVLFIVFRNVRVGLGYVDVIRLLGIEV